MGIRSSIRRHPRAWTGIAVVAAGLIVVVLAWFQPQKLFLDQKVDEAVPTAAPAHSSAAPRAPTDPASTSTAVASATPAPRQEVLASGGFRSLEHHSTGVARLLRVADGSLFLRFEGLDTSNGPDLVVYLSAREANGDLHGWDQGEFVDLGSLKGNVGDQNYLLPAGTDPARYRSAVIWCRRFKVGFAVAPLEA
jgi:hypothetical protein